MDAIYERTPIGVIIEEIVIFIIIAHAAKQKIDITRMGTIRYINMAI